MFIVSRWKVKKTFQIGVSAFSDYLNKDSKFVKGQIFYSGLMTSRLTLRSNCSSCNNKRLVSG